MKSKPTPALQSHHAERTHRFRLSVRALVVAVACLAAAACGSNAGNQTTSELPRGNWFCQPTADESGWDCVSDETLANSSDPASVARPPAEPPPATAPAAAAATAAAAGADSTAAEAPQSPSAAEVPGEDAVPVSEVAVPAADADLPSAADTSTAAAAGTATAALPETEPAAPVPQPAPMPVTEGDVDDLPEYARLAYQPEQPVALSELPPEFYAVQLVAVTTREALDAYARRHDLKGLSGARVARNGEIYYVLLLGVYETLEDAERAVNSMPIPLSDVEAWIRTVGSLQAAMRAAEELAASG